MWWDGLFETLAPGAVVAAVIAGAAFLAKVIIQGNLQHHFDKKIEHLRDDLGRNNSRIDAIQSSTLSLMSTRHAALDARRLRAIEDLWTATVHQRRWGAAVKTLQVINVKEISKTFDAGGSDRDKIIQFGEMMFKLAGLENITANNAPLADSERLFVPPLAWTAFEALRAVCSHSLAILLTIKSGVSLSLVKDLSDVNNLVVLALPGMEDFVKKYPDSGVYFMTDQLEKLVFDQLAIALNFQDTDREILDKATDIVNRIGDHNLSGLDGIPEKYLRAENSIPKP